MAPTNTRRRAFGVIAVLSACAALALAVATVIPLVRYSGYTVQGGSMAPTIGAGHRLRTTPVDGVERGDIVVLRPPARADLPASVVIRVVAVAGQTVSVRGGRLYLDGRPAAEPYLVPGAETRAAGTVRVPPGHVYVLGDNRMITLGSNSYGPVPVRSILGRVVDVDAPSTPVVLVRLAGLVVVALLAALLARRLLRSVADRPMPNPLN